MRLTFAVLCSLAIFSVAKAHAALIAYDGFDYSPSSSPVGQNGGTGWSTPWSSLGSASTIAPGSLASPGGNLATSGNHLTVSYPTGGFIFGGDTRFLQSMQGADGTQLWVSLLIEETAASTGFHYGGLSVPGLYIGDPGLGTGAVGAADQWVIQNNNDTGTVSSGIPVVVGQTVLLVVQFIFNPGNDTINLFVNPPVGAASPGIPNATKTDIDLGMFNQTTVAYGKDVGTGTSYNFDEIRFGTTYADVTPTPEPSSFVLMGCLGLIVLSQRFAGAVLRRGVGRPATS